MHKDCVTETTWWSKMFKFETVILSIAVLFLVTFHDLASQDRFLLVLYHLAATGASYALVRRRALGFAATTITVAGCSIFADSYFAAKSDIWSPWFDGPRDLLAFAVLLVVTYLVLLELYRMQKEEKARELSRIAEREIIRLRAAALRSTSHEVRTPLTTITALSEMLNDETAGPLNEIQREFVHGIDEAAHHLLALVNDILDYAKAEAGMITLMPEQVALAEIVEQCTSMILPKATAAGVSLSAHLDPDLKEITADPLRLKQILLNLMTNAVKFNQSGGTVTVRVRSDDQYVLFTVRDTGRGIDPAHLTHLFDPYYQAALADQSIGTGLGLAIIKHLTELHGGTVSVESVVGTGSVFSVRLPRGACRKTASFELDGSRDQTANRDAGLALSS